MGLQHEARLIFEIFFWRYSLKSPPQLILIGVDNPICPDINLAHLSGCIFLLTDSLVIAGPLPFCKR
jgi:hypothetical protein